MPSIVRMTVHPKKTRRAHTHTLHSVTALYRMLPSPRHAHARGGFQHVRDQERRHPSGTAALRRRVAPCCSHPARHRQARRCDGPGAQRSAGLCQGPRVRHARRQHRGHRQYQLVPRGGREVRVRGGNASAPASPPTLAAFCGANLIHPATGAR